MEKRKIVKPKKKKPLLSIVVVSYQNAAILELCLNSIIEEVNSLKKIIKAESEVLVVDSGAIEKTRDVVKQFILDQKPVKYFSFKKNTGFSKAVNKGIKESAGDFLLILNADIILTKNSLGKMINYLKENSRVGILGPKLLNFDGSPQISAFHFYTPSIILYRRTILGKTAWGKRKLQNFVIDFSAKKAPVSFDGWLMGSALMLRRDNLEKIGSMDERYFMYFEDVDWCRRFREAGFEIVYFPLSALFHYHGKQSATRHFWDAFLNPMTLVHIQSAFKYFWKFRK